MTANPDPETLRVRFIFGSCFGLVCGVISALQFTSNIVGVIVVTMCISLFCGYGAMSLGDDFWKNVHKYYPW